MQFFCTVKLVALHLCCQSLFNDILWSCYTQTVGDMQLREFSLRKRATQLALSESMAQYSQLRRTSDPNLTLSQSEPPQGFCPPKISLSYVIANLSQPCICALAATSITKIPRHLPRGRRAPLEPHKLFNPPFSRNQSIARSRPGRRLIFHVWAG